MPGSFFDAWNSTLLTFESSFTEDWTLNNIVWPAIAIEDLGEEHHIIKGGTILDARVRIHVRDDVFYGSGVQIGNFISARGLEMTVLQIHSEGDASKTLTCAAKGIDVWR